MPDPNKLKRMAEEGYRIAESCSTCIRGPGVHLSEDGWGKCHGPNRKYLHEKHGEKNLPAHICLTCDDWRPKSDLEAFLGAYASEPWKTANNVREDYGYLLALVEHLRDGMNNLREPLPLDTIAKTCTSMAAIARKLLRDRIDRLRKEKDGCTT